MNRIICLAVLLFFQLSTVIAQQSPATDPRITEVYGNYAQQLTPEQMAWTQTKLQRSEVHLLPFSASEQYPKLSSLSVINKYVPSLVMDSVFDPTHINPLKYTIDFYNTQEDLIYRIDNTDYVLFIAKKN